MQLKRTRSAVHSAARDAQASAAMQCAKRCLEEVQLFPVFEIGSLVCKPCEIAVSCVKEKVRNHMRKNHVDLKGDVLRNVLCAADAVKTHMTVSESDNEYVKCAKFPQAGELVKVPAIQHIPITSTKKCPLCTFLTPKDDSLRSHVFKEHGRKISREAEQEMEWIPAQSLQKRKRDQWFVAIAAASVQQAVVSRSHACMQSGLGADSEHLHSRLALRVLHHNYEDELCTDDALEIPDKELSSFVSRVEPHKALALYEIRMQLAAELVKRASEGQSGSWQKLGAVLRA